MLFRDITQVAFALLSLVAIAVYFVRMHNLNELRKKPNMERKILDALIKLGCVEDPPFTPRAAAASEIAPLVYNKFEYIRHQNIYNMQMTCYLMGMEKSDVLGNSGEITDIPAVADIKGRWYIKWHFPSD